MLPHSHLHRQTIEPLSARLLVSSKTSNFPNFLPLKLFLLYFITGKKEAEEKAEEYINKIKNGMSLDFENVNVGNEEGGLHYCIVLDKINAKSYSTLTVVPLSSLKPKAKIRDTQVYLGHELFDKLHAKYTSLRDRSLDRAIEVQKKLEDYERNNVPFRATPEDFKAMQDANLCFKVGTEIVQMKTGTIALINQITTISKQRIYDPKNDLGILSDVRISDKYLDLIDKKIQKLFLKN